MKFVGKTAKEMEKIEKEEMKKRREKIRKEIKEMIEEKKRDNNKDVKTFKIRINDREIEVPEGFEVLATEEGIIIRKSSTKEAIIILKEIFELLVAFRDEGIPVDTGPVVTI